MVPTIDTEFFCVSDNTQRCILAIIQNRSNMALERVLAFEEYDQQWWQVDTMFGDAHQRQLHQSWWEREIALASDVPIVTLRCNGYSGTVVEMIREGRVVNDLNGFEFLLRSYQTRPENVGQLGGNPIVTLEQTERLYRWPLDIDEGFTQRKMAVIALSDLFPDKKRPNWELLRPYKRGPNGKEGKFFIKTMRKHRELVKRRNSTFVVSEFGKDTPLLDVYGPFLEDGSIDSFIVSEPLEFDPKGYQAIEYRVWIANGRIAGVNTNENVYRKDFTPIEVGRFAQRFIKRHSDVLPWGYVIDIGLVEGEPVLVEINHLSASGRFSGHDFSIVLEEFSPRFDRRKFEAAMPGLLRRDAENTERSYGSRTHRFWH